MKFQLARCDVWCGLSINCQTVITFSSKYFLHSLWGSRGGSENSERGDRVPLPPLRMKTSIITTLKGRLEGWESYKHVLKIQEKKGAAAPPLNPPMGSSLFLKIHEKKSCIRVSLGNVYRQGMWFGFKYCHGCLKDTLEMVSEWGEFLWHCLLFLPQ